MDIIRTDLIDILDRCNRSVARLELLKEQHLKALQKRTVLEKRTIDLKKARLILQTVGKATQQKLELHISNLVSTALRAVFPHPPEFRMKIETRRNQTECDLQFCDDGEHWYTPILGSGFGPLDVASFALRVAFWSIHKNRPVMILDEPFRNVSPDLHPKVSDMLSMISKNLRLQIIMVSHSEEINVSADKTFFVEKKDGVSIVRSI